MQDERGIYYYPVLQNKRLRMYVRPGFDSVQFRMWDADDPTLWDEHGWVSWDAVVQAAGLYMEEGRKGKAPLHLYDIEIARRLIRDAAQGDRL